MRRTLLIGVLGIAVLSAGSIAIIHRFLGAPPRDAAPSVADADVIATAVSPVGAGPGIPTRAAAIPPPVEQAERAIAAEAPRPVPGQRGDSPGTRVAQPARRGPHAITVSFQKDPRLTSGLHMGARWVSPPTYVGLQAGSLFTIPARARAAARQTDETTWLPDQPHMVAVTPDHGSEVEIAVLSEGRSTVAVASGDASTTLTVNAVRQDGVWRVDISQ